MLCDVAGSEKIILPPKYYLDYFEYLLDFIQKGSSHLLGEGDKNFIQTFESISEDARCLMVRMMNRKGEYFRLEKFQYEEISNIPAAADELVKVDFISLEPPEDFLLFRLFTKAELHEIFPERDYNKKKKEEILLELAEENSKADYLTLGAKYTIMHFLVQEQIEYLKLLFFGHAHGMMTEFVIRDIGNVKLENLNGHTFTPWFDTEAEARSVFQLYKWDYTIRQAMPILIPEEILELISQVNWSDFLQHPKSRKIGDRFMLRLGEYFEKSGFPREALDYYSLARKHPARERIIRILDKNDEQESAREIAEEVINRPYNASEQIFAQDYLAKTGKRNYRSTTTKINASPEITINDPIGQRVEQHALSHFTSQGFQGAHTENYLWRGLFGLLFWEELFDQQHATFHHPLQRMPSDLYSEFFYQNRGEILISKTKKLRTKKQLLKHLTATYESKKGISNYLVGWHESLLPTIEACIKHLPLKGLYNVLLEMAKNTKDNSAGFPDLFLWNEKTYYFYEIKSPNDHLSAQQLFWIDFMNSNKIKADILRVKYLT